MSADRERRVELLLGKRVRDPDGRSVGRIEEIVARERDGELVVESWLVGSDVLWSRFGASRIGRAMLRQLRLHRHRPSYAIPWDAMDLSDPDSPRTTLSAAELSRHQLKE